MAKDGSPPKMAAWSRVPDTERRYALLILTLVYVSSYMDRNIFSIVLEPIKKEMHFSDTELGLLTGPAFAFVYAFGGIPIAWLADRWNRRNIVAISITIWSFMTAFTGFAGNFLQLFAARIGVGIGEAGSAPPSHSMIADLYPREKRAGALGFYNLAIYVALAISFVGGGWLVDEFGWRPVFFTFGIPGLIVAALVRFTLREPERAPPPPGQSGEPAKLLDGIRFVLKSKAAIFFIFGATCTSFVGSGAAQWLPAFLIRSYGLSTREAGLILGPVMAIFAATGVVFGGWLADRMSRRDLRWPAWLIAGAKIVSVPLIGSFYFFHDLRIGLPIYCVGAIFGAFYFGPLQAMLQSLSPPRLRAMTAAILLLMINFIGLGLGPLFAGIVSDLLTPTLGKEALRYSLLIFSSANLLGGALFFLGAHHYREEINRATWDKPPAPASG
ncbi:MAG: MFS transporter [Alphaproteobacteria bacterium]|nr:MFS transporter [Alphaproteobacteria bacterium]